MCAYAHINVCIYKYVHIFYRYVFLYITMQAAQSIQCYLCICNSALSTVLGNQFGRSTLCGGSFLMKMILPGLNIPSSLVVLCLWLNHHEISPFYVNISVGVIVWVLCRQPCWWDFMDVKFSDISRNYKLTANFLLNWLLKSLGSLIHRGRSVLYEYHSELGTAGSLVLYIFPGCGSVLVSIYFKEMFIWWLGNTCI